jgi:hypothetical protein
MKWTISSKDKSTRDHLRKIEKVLSEKPFHKENPRSMSFIDKSYQILKEDRPPSLPEN